MGATISVGVCILATTDWFQPHVVVCGARRTPRPHAAPTGSESSISDQTTFATAGSVCVAHCVCRAHNASRSARDCVLNAAPSAGTFAGGVAELLRAYAGASSTSRLTLSGKRAAYPPALGPPSDHA